VIVGVTKDPQFGHAVMFGSGDLRRGDEGRDVPGCAALGKDASEMISGSGIRALTGTRGNPADLDACTPFSSRCPLPLRSPQVEEMTSIGHRPRAGLTIADAGGPGS